LFAAAAAAAVGSGSVAPVYMRYHELVHFSWVRWLLDEQGECEHRARLIMKELDSFFIKAPIL
jgi:hypothetical protein